MDKAKSIHIEAEGGEEEDRLRPASIKGAINETRLILPCRHRLSASLSCLLLRRLVLNSVGSACMRVEMLTPPALVECIYRITLYIPNLTLRFLFSSPCHSLFSFDIARPSDGSRTRLALSLSLPTELSLASQNRHPYSFSPLAAPLLALPFSLSFPLALGPTHFTYRHRN
jgi:hypothetical protein